MTVPSVGTYNAAMPQQFSADVDFGAGATPNVFQTTPARTRTTPAQMMPVRKLAHHDMISTPSNTKTASSAGIERRGGAGAHSAATMETDSPAPSKK
jgi:hypothetical protein